MSYLPAKRQRSNTSRESGNVIPQTNPPALRQHQQHHHQHHHHPQQPQLNGTIAIYPTVLAAAAYTNDAYAQQTHSQQQYSAYAANGYGANAGGGPYQNTTSSATYGATSPYSPQHPTPNPYANQYAQPSPQLSPHYTSNGLNGAHGLSNTYHQSQQPSRITYSPIPTPHPTTAAAYHQPPSRGDAAIAALQSAQQHGLSSYDSYPSHSPSHASHYQSTQSPYPDTSVTSHYSPGTISTPLNMSRHMSEDFGAGENDDQQEDDDEDAQGEPADESPEIQLYPIRPPPASSSSTDQQLKSAPDTKCACKKGRGKKRTCQSCACSRYGRGCSSSCACGTACGNPFADLSTFFGPSGAFTKPCGANPCFATWLTNQPNIEELDMDLMVDMLLSDDESWAQTREYTDAFQQWETNWKKVKNSKAKKSKDDRERLEFELLRGALGDCNPDGFNGFRYSFCQSKWVPFDLLDHCSDCGNCRPTGEWHCEQHGRCTEDRECPSCVSSISTTLPYHHQ
ncbi:hypothetical protein F5Y16DRAFT_403394 [Xylariaceae sp. FL0255]|nr:hypothetical protein F5Y16DRAFT_403394 [Xylariaceae sp. FL0255]